VTPEVVVHLDREALEVQGMLEMDVSVMGAREV
jgi:hypothetical protein